MPELGYLSTDRPYPRGELLLRTETITPGYYKRPEATAAVFGEDGFYRTGDTMAETGPDQLAYLDRRDNVLNRPQGEFVILSRLERVFVTGSLVRQIYIYGNSERDYLLAVIVPTEEAVRRAANRDELSWVLRESLQLVARQAELESYEIPRDFLVETEPFSVENGLLSEIRKDLPPPAQGPLRRPPRSPLPSGMLLAHRRHAGQLKVPDLFTRLLFSLVTTGIARPASTTPTIRGTARVPTAKVCPSTPSPGPSTLSARAIPAATERTTRPPHDDGLPLDTFVDWLIDAGRTIHRVEGHDT